MALLLAAALTIAPAVAVAHVRVIPDSTASGSFSQLTFRVPTESDTAATVKVQVQLPKDRPLLYVATKPIPGWTAKVVESALPEPVESYGTTITKAASSVTWTATSAASAIKPGEYQEFSVSAGPLPVAGELLLPATQTYSDGTVVAWDEPPSRSGAELEHPAPILTVTGADESANTPVEPSASAASVSTGAGTDWLARGLGMGGLGVGAAGIVVAVSAVLAVRRSVGRT